MKHRLANLFFVFVVLISLGTFLPQKHASAADTSLPCATGLPTCTDPLSPSDQQPSIAKACPQTIFSFPTIQNPYLTGGPTPAPGNFIYCEQTWAKAPGNVGKQYVPNTFEGGQGTGVPDYCHRLFTSSYLASCERGYGDGPGADCGKDALCKLGAYARVQLDASNQNNSTNNPSSSEARSNCNGKSGSLYKACVAGYDGQTAGKTIDEACKNLKGKSLDTCKAAWNQSQADSPSGGSTKTTCEAGSFSFNWVLCAAYDGISSVTQWMFNDLVQPLLMTNPICLDTSASPACDNTIYRVWSGFRIYGDIFLIIVLLVIVFGESIGGGLIDAYTAKKILPRLLAAAVLINLSIYIMAFMIDITNVIGGGLGQLLTAPLGANNHFYQIQPDGIQQAEIFGAGATAGLLAGAFVISVTGVALLIAGLALTGLIAIVGVFVTLIIRQSIIVALLLISPVAFALWCLPNTQQWFKKWWDTFFQMMLVYPMIIVAFAVADILGAITANNKGSGSSGLNIIVSFMLLIIPLYMIPFMLRSSNRILGAVQGAVSNVGRQINAVSGRRVLSAAGAEAGKTFSRARSGDRFRGAAEGSMQNRLNRRIAQAANLDALGRTGLRPRNIRDSVNASVVANKNVARRKLAEDSAAFQTFAGNDDMLEASMLLYHDGEQAARARLEQGHVTGQQQDTSIAQIRAAQRDMGAQNLALTSAVANAATGTGFAAGPGQAYDSIIRAAGGDMSLAGSAYAEARGNFEKARRYDAMEGFAGAMQHMSDINTAAPGAERDAAIQRANEEAADAALEVQGIGAVISGRGQSARNFGPALQRRIQHAEDAYHDALATGTTTIPQYNSDTGEMENVTLTADQAQRNWIQVMASTSAAIDSAGPAAPEVQRLLADTVHNGQVDVTAFPDDIKALISRNQDGTHAITTVPLSQAMSNLEGREEFAQIKKVYTQRYQQDAAAAAAAGGAGPGAGGAGGAGGVGPIPGGPGGPT